MSSADRAPAKVLGVLGGMGPAATVDFMGKLVAGVNAARDQDHLPVVVVNDPRVPNRTQAILNGDEKPVYEALLAGVRRLEAAGVDAIAIPCNTAHHWLDALKKSTKLQFIDIVQATADALRRQVPPGAGVAILGTQGTRASGLHLRRLIAEGYMSLELESTQQDDLSLAIELIKAGRTKSATEKLRPILDDIEARGARGVLLACTELPIALAGEPNRSIALIDTTQALVDACIAWAWPVR